MSIFRKFLEATLRICVFQLGEYKNSFYAKFIVWTIKRRYDVPYRKLPLDTKHLDYFIHVLEDLGGTRSFKRTLDGQATIDYMLLSYSNVKKRVEQKGGKWVEIAVHRNADETYQLTNESQENVQYLQIIYSDNETSEWQDFYENVLIKMGWEKTIIEFPEAKKEVLITFESRMKIVPRNHPICFLRCHSPGRSYGMDKIYIQRHLGLQHDLCLFNYRGTHDSTGKPSEGGYYLDADTLFQELINTFSYQPQNIWVSGFCLGGAVAAYIKAKYHHLGVSYAGENTFTSLEKLIKNLLWPANILAEKVIDSLRSQDPAVTGNVQQDLFNTLNKFNKLKRETINSISVIVNTDHDPVLPEDSAEELYLAVKRIGTAFKITHKNHHRGSPHTDDLFADEKAWEEYSHIISAKRPED